MSLHLIALRRWRAWRAEIVQIVRVCIQCTAFLFFKRTLLEGICDL